MPVSIHKRPSARMIQPIGLRGRLEAIRAPTSGKTRKGTPPMNLPTERSTSQLPGTCADRVRTNSGKVATHITTQRPASDHDNQKTTRAPSPPRPSSLADSITTPLYSTTVSQTLREPLRTQPLQ